MEMDINKILSQSVRLSIVHSQFYKIWDSKNFDNSGVYLLQRIDENEKIKPIPRLLDSDDQGVLYIGKSDNLNNRLGILINLLNGTSTTGKHSMGRRFQEIEKFQEYLRPENMILRIFFCDSPRQVESSLLEEYLQEYGELPPLNNSR